MKSKSLSDRLVDITSYLFMLIFSIFCLIPFLIVIMSSITDEATILKNGYGLIPEKISFAAYKVIFENDVIPNAYKVTIFVTVVGTVLSLIITSAMAYAISVKSLKYRNKIAFYVYFTMLFNGGLVPSYILISKYLNMRNNIWVLIIPALVNPWNMFLLRNFFNSIPESLSESAKIDGANDIYILFKIILPVSLPAMATIGLFYALGYWNEWFKAMMYIGKKDLYPLQYIIMKIMRSLNEVLPVDAPTVNSIAPSYGVRMSTAVVTVGPIIFLYPFLQKYFVKGLMVGSIKG